MLARSGARLGVDAPTSDLERSPASALVLLAVTLAALLALRIAALWLNQTDLFFDEAQYWSWGEAPAFGYFSKPPLIAWIIALSTSLCGTSEFCIRLPAPIIHTVTAVLVYAIGRQVGGARVGLWSALAFVTVPGISLSSGIISTDVPLLACWAAALLALMRLMDGPGWGSAIALGIAAGLGLNAKYAMVFFVPCLIVYLAATPGRRGLLRDPRLYVAGLIAAALIAPNLLWNLSNSFVTFAHTADNANWTGRLLNPARGLEFLGAQLGVFGPILFLALVGALAIAWREGLAEKERLLLAFSVPVVLLITAQAFISRAHANWAATAYVAASVLVVSLLIRRGKTGWLKASLALHLVVGLALAAGTSYARSITFPAAGEALGRTLGWREMAEEVRRLIEMRQKTANPFRAVITDDRSLTAELMYYLRDHQALVMAWRDKGRVRDHYELTRPYVDPGLEPVLLVSVRADPRLITDRFKSSVDLGQRTVPTAAGKTRSFRLYALGGYLGAASEPAKRSP